MPSEQTRQPDGYAYRYPDGVRHNDGVAVNGSSPIEAIPYFYSPAPDAWRCFHCDEVFTIRASALEHFGASLSSLPACQIDITEYRRMEENHANDLRRAEEKGYARGIKDMADHD